MSISTQLTRISNDRDTIRTKLVGLGIATSTDNLDALANAIDNIADKGTPDAEVKEGESYTIEAGYYKGGTVKGVAGGGHYELQAKEGITPTKNVQTVTPDEGYYGLSQVQVDPIPENYQDVSSVTAKAADVLANKSFVNQEGGLQAGTMPNNGAIERKLDGETTSVNVPEGYHNGNGTVSVDVEEKTATPTKSVQSIVPTTGKLLKKVTVDAIPDQYIDASSVDAEASHILAGKKAVAKTGENTYEVVDGTMSNNGAISGEIDGFTATEFDIPAGYTTGGKVSLTDDIEQALALI